MLTLKVLLPFWIESVAQQDNFARSQHKAAWCQTQRTDSGIHRTVFHSNQRQFPDLELKDCLRCGVALIAVTCLAIAA